MAQLLKQLFTVVPVLIIKIISCNTLITVSTSHGLADYETMNP